MFSLSHKFLIEISLILIFFVWYLIKDESKSGNLAGFGIPNYMYSHKVFIHKDQYEDASLFIPEIIKQDKI